MASQPDFARVRDEQVSEHLTRVQASLDGAEATGDTDRAERLRGEQAKWVKIQAEWRRHV